MRKDRICCRDCILAMIKLQNVYNEEGNRQIQYIYQIEIPVIPVVYKVRQMMYTQHNLHNSHIFRKVFTK